MPTVTRSDATNEFARRFDDALDARGWSLNKLRVTLRVSSGYVNRLRTRGAQQIAPDTMFAIADALGVEARWLFTGTGSRDGRTPEAHAAPVDARADDEVRRLRDRVARLEEILGGIERDARSALRRRA